jgi:hypothetical protein
VCATLPPLSLCCANPACENECVGAERHAPGVAARRVQALPGGAVLQHRLPARTLGRAPQPGQRGGGGVGRWLLRRRWRRRRPTPLRLTGT